ncbi:MAG: hypothetical protein ACHQ5A_10990, partial [Opitutales bacterium]
GAGGPSSSLGWWRSGGWPPTPSSTPRHGFFEAGFDAYFAKPIADPPELLRTVERLASGGRRALGVRRRRRA